jgi:two-component system, OmpR family, phosphate regulon sensor histidine kinase PhoR
MKNATPQQLAFLVSAFIVTCVSFISVLFFGFRVLEANGFLFFNYTIGLMLITYFSVYLSIKIYIKNRIKLIYKNILKNKNAPVDKSNTIDYASNIFEQVEHDVLSWMVSSREQMNSMHEMEEYRRNFVGNVSHELKTPIFNVQGFLCTVLENENMNEDKKKDYLQRALKNVERLETIVEDLQTISKYESGMEHLNFQSTNMVHLTEDVIEHLQLKAAEKNIKLLIQNHCKNQLLVNIDSKRIHQVLTNLINNSIKYGKENGETIINFFDMDSHCLVEVADNGIGINQSHHQYLFDRFYRVDKARARKEGGSGLGLSIVKHIIEAHKQTITVRSTPNVGSTFGFTLEIV